MKTKTAGATGNTMKDPVCGMSVVRMQSGTPASEFKGRVYYFCSSDCKRKFDQNPSHYHVSASGPYE
jgi:Cu+-exporting ATPase